MSLSLRPYQSADLTALHRLYSLLTVGRVPHCHAVEPATLGGLLSAPAGVSPNSEASRLADRLVLVCEVDGEAAGFIDLGSEAPRQDEYAPRGIVRFLAYPRGRRDVGTALLTAGQDWLREHGQTVCHVMPQVWRYPFYGYAHAYLSDHLDHVLALLLWHGYHRAGGEVFLDWPNMDPIVPAPPVQLDFELKQESVPGQGLRDGLRLQAVHGDDVLGTCYLRSAGDFSTVQAVQETAFCDWLGVREPYQGAGLGRFLLATALRRAYDAGYRDAAISTALANHRAFLFYSNHGFQVVDWTYELVRELPAGE